MHLKDWNDRFCGSLAKLARTNIDGKSNADTGWWTLKIGKLGLLVMDDDEEAVVWLLDAEGRTDGPAWSGNMAEASALEAAHEIARLIEKTPDDVSFQAYAPIGTDRAKEDVLNAVWADVLVRIGRIRTDSLIDGRPDKALREIEDYIDERARTDSTGTVAECAGPFKVSAAQLLRGEV